MKVLFTYPFLTIDTIIILGSKVVLVSVCVFALRFHTLSCVFRFTEFHEPEIRVLKAEKVKRRVFLNRGP